MFSKQSHVEVKPDYPKSKTCMPALKAGQSPDETAVKGSAAAISTAICKGTGRRRGLSPR